MDAKDLKEVGRQIAVAIFENKSIEEVVYGMGKVMSYLESEQEKRRRLEAAINENSVSTKINTAKMEELQRQLWGSEDKPGLIHVIDSLKANSDRNSKMLRGIFTTMAGVFGLELIRIAAQHIKL